MPPISKETSFSIATCVRPARKSAPPLGGLHQPDGKPDGGIQGRHPAAGGHHQHGTVDTVLKRVSAKWRRYFSIRGRMKALATVVQRRSNSRISGLTSLERLTGRCGWRCRSAHECPLMGGIGIAVEQAGPDALGPRRGKISSTTIESRFVERQEDVAPGRHPLRHGVAMLPLGDHVRLVEEMSYWS